MSNLINKIDSVKDKTELFLIGAKLKVNKAVRDFFDNEDGDIVQTVIIIAILATLTIVVVTLIGNAVKSRAEEAGDAIGGFNTYK